MHSFPPWTAAARRALAAHLDRLRQSLAALGERLREAVAQSAGGTAAGVVRQAVATLLAAPDAPLWATRPPGRSVHLWRNPYDRDDVYDDEAPDEWAGPREVSEEDPVPDMPPTGSRLLRWARALAVGCQAAAWWLRRQAGRHASLTALGLGLLAALAAYAAGPAIAGAALALFVLADCPDAGPGTLPWPNTR